MSADETYDKNNQYCSEVRNYISELIGSSDIQEVKDTISPILVKLGDIKVSEFENEATYFKLALYEHQAKALYNLATIYYGQADDIKNSARNTFDELCKIINGLEPLDVEFDYDAQLFGAYVAPADSETVNPESGYCATLQYHVACEKLDNLLVNDQTSEGNDDAKKANLLKIVEDAKADLVGLSGEDNVGFKSVAYSNKISETEIVLGLRREYDSICEGGEKEEFKAIYEKYLNLIKNPGETPISDILEDAVFDLREAKFIDDHKDAYTLNVEGLVEDNAIAALAVLEKALADLETGNFVDVERHLTDKVKTLVAQEVGRLMESASDKDDALKNHLKNAIEGSEGMSVDEARAIINLVKEHSSLCRSWLRLDTQTALADITKRAVEKIISGDGECNAVADNAILELYKTEAEASLLDYIARHEGEYPDVKEAIELIKNNALNLEGLNKDEYKQAMAEAKEKISVLFELQDKKNEAYAIIDALTNYTDAEKNALKKQVDDALTGAILSISDESQDKIDVDLIRKSAVSGIETLETNASKDNLAKVKNNALTSLDGEKKKFDALLEDADYLSESKKNELKAQYDGEYNAALEVINASADVNEINAVAQSAIASLKLKQEEAKALDKDACMSIFVPIIVALAVFGAFEAAALALILRRKKRDDGGDEQEENSDETDEVETSACGTVVALAVTGFEVTMWSFTAVLGVADIVLAILIVYFAFIKPRKVEKPAVVAVIPEDATEEPEDEQEKEPIEENEMLDLGAFLIDIEKKTPANVPETVEETEEVEEVEEIEEVEETEPVFEEEPDIEPEIEPEIEQEVEPEIEKAAEIETAPKPVVSVNIQKAKVRQAIVNIDQLEKYFEAGDVVDVDVLKEKKLIPAKSGCIKVLGRGMLHKPLVVVAREFSSTAQKMIIEAGGAAKMDTTEVVINS